MSESEIESYSEEEVLCDDEQQIEQEIAIKAILNESETLEREQQQTQDETPAPKSDKGKHKKQRGQNQKSVDSAFWEVLASIQNDIRSLKRERPAAEDVDSQPGANAVRKVPKLGVLNLAREAITPADRPSSSKAGQLIVEQLSPAKSTKQLSPAKSTKQLSPAKSTKQLSPAASRQLSPAKKKQLSTARQQVRQKTPERSPRGDDAVEIEEDSGDDDPLRQEVQQNRVNVISTGAGASAVDETDDGESTDDDNNNDDFFEEMVGAIDIRGDEDVPGNPLNQSWAEKINLAWTTKLPKATLSSLLTKYRTPNNLTDLKVPKMNKEIWRLCDKFQRKNDINLAQSQRCLVKAATAVLNLHEHFNTLPRGTRQLAMQTTADVISLFGKVNREVTSKRKMMTRPNLKGDFKYLSSSTNTTENLFGDNLTQDIKDIQVKRKIENPYNAGYNTYNYRGSGSRRGQFRGGYNGRNNSNYHNSGGNFLGRGRGRDRYQPRASHNNQSRGKK